MTTRRIESGLELSPEMERLLRDVPALSEEEMYEQRISFAYGQLAIENPNVTKDDVRRAAEKLYGRR